MPWGDPSSRVLRKNVKMNTGTVFARMVQGTVTLSGYPKSCLCLWTVGLFVGACSLGES